MKVMNVSITLRRIRMIIPANHKEYPQRNPQVKVHHYFVTKKVKFYPYFVTRNDGNYPYFVTRCVPKKV